VLDEQKVNAPDINEPDINEPQPADSYVSDPGPLTSAFPDPVHYPAKELDVYPRLLAPLAVSYPERADQPDGRVSLLLLIDEAGRVSGVTVVDSEPEGVFDDAAVRAYSLAAFSPARKDGRAVRSRILVAVEIKAAMRAEGE
jgi:protein TonB